MDVKMRKAHNLLWACRARWGLGPKVVHWLYVSIIRPSTSFSSLVWWSGSKTASAEKTKQKTKTSMLRDNGSDLYHFYWCYGGTHWPASVGSVDST